MRGPTRFRGAAAALVLLAAACGDSAAPSFSDPAAFNAEMGRVEEAFNTTELEGFVALSSYMAPPSSPSATLLRATLPQGMVQRSQPRAVAAATALRAMIPQLSGPARGPLIPDALYGKAYEWDATAEAYVESTTRTGPGNGVRFFVYAINPFTDLPASTPVEVGYADLMDESTSPSALALHIRVTSSASVVHLDYTVTVTAGAGAFTAGAAGYVRNGLGGAGLRRLDFTIAFSASETSTTADLSADATFTLNTSGVSLEIHDNVHFAETGVTFARDFRFRRPGEVIRVLGSLTIGETSVNGQITIRINDRLFVQATFSGTQVTRNRNLSRDEEQLVGQLLGATDTVWSAIDGFFTPAYINS